MRDDWRTAVLWVVVIGLWAGAAWFIGRTLEMFENNVTAVYGIRGDSLGDGNGTE